MKPPPTPSSCHVNQPKHFSTFSLLRILSVFIFSCPNAFFQHRIPPPQLHASKGARRALEASQRSPTLRLGEWVLKVGYSNSQQLKLAHRPPGASTVSVKSTRYDQSLPDRGHGHGHGNGEPYSGQRRGPPPGDGGRGNYPVGGVCTSHHRSQARRTCMGYSHSISRFLSFISKSVPELLLL